jgi:hypothetical protein
MFRTSFSVTSYTSLFLSIFGHTSCFSVIIAYPGPTRDRAPGNVAHAAQTITGERPWPEHLAPGHAVFPPPAACHRPAAPRSDTGCCHPAGHLNSPAFFPVPYRETHHNLHHPSLRFLRWPGRAQKATDAHYYSATCTVISSKCDVVEKMDGPIPKRLGRGPGKASQPDQAGSLDGFRPKRRTTAWLGSRVDAMSQLHAKTLVQSAVCMAFQERAAPSIRSRGMPLYCWCSFHVICIDAKQGCS